MKHTTIKTLMSIASWCLFSFSVQAVSDTLVKANTSWKYLDNGSNQGAAWFGTSFNDASWASGNSELGYGDGDEATTVSYGGDAANKYITTYFRKTFNVTNPASYQSLFFELVRDDGAVVYLNGVEIHRNNMPTSSILYNTLATLNIGGTDESAWNLVTITPSMLVAGTNTIAVEIHQSGIASSDISFNFRLIANTNPTATLLRQPYLQSLTQNSIVIRWRTDVACDTKVSY